MPKHRALIVGCGRMGVGRNWIETPYIYTHAGAYRALSDRVELVGVVDSNPAFAVEAGEKWGVDWQCDLGTALAAIKPDIVSVCTPPTDRMAPIASCYFGGVKGVWCEKPYGLRGDEVATTYPIQVNYIRRFDPIHHRQHKQDELWVWAKKDIHTVCHFTDLARHWGVPRAGLHYFHMDGPNSYVVRGYGGTELFPLGGVVGGFMENALANLLDAVEGKAELISPPESAIESEKWANEILAEKANAST